MDHQEALCVLPDFNFYKWIINGLSVDSKKESLEAG